MENKGYKIGIRTKLTLLAIGAGATLLILTMFVLRSSMTKLDEDLVAERLHADINHVRRVIGTGDWNVQNGFLMVGNTIVGDGTQKNAYLAPFYLCEEETGTFFYTFIKVSDDNLSWVGDRQTGYQQGHFLRVAGSTKGPNGESIVGTYMDKIVSDILDTNDVYLGPANVNGRQIYCIYETLKDSSGTVVGAIVAGRSIEEMHNRIVHYSFTYMGIYGVVIGVVIGIIYIISARWINAARKIKDYLGQVGDGKLPAEKLVIFNNDEMGSIAQSINEMVVSLRERELLKSYRQTVEKSALFTFCTNVTKNMLVEGAGQFAALANEDGIVTYDSILDFLVAEVVDEEHQEMVRSMSNSDYLETQIGVDPEFEITYKVSIHNLLRYAHLPMELQKQLLNSGKDWTWVSSRTVLVRNPEGDLLSYVDILDVDQKVVDAEKIKMMATTDSLTGLYNRRAFEDSLRHSLDENNISGTLFLMDLDHFKEVNDNLGHPEGDELLKVTSETIRHIFRDGDIVCRLGGDEFCAFAKGFTNVELLKRRAEELNNKSRRVYTAPGGKKITVSMSVGVSICPFDARDFDSLYECADKALYRSKERGRDCYTFFFDHEK